MLTWDSFCTTSAKSVLSDDPLSLNTRMMETDKSTGCVDLDMLLNVSKTSFLLNIGVSTHHIVERMKWDNK